MAKDKRQEESVEELVRELIRHPAWTLIEDKVKTMLKNADRDFHQADTKTFERTKGYYEGIKALHYIIVENPADIAKDNGKVKLGGNNG